MEFNGKQQKEGSQNNDLLHAIAKFASNSTMIGIFCFMAHNNVNWAIDNGTSSHMCDSLSNFSHYKHVSSLNHSITIPNGTKIKVSKIGAVRLFDNILLKNVLYVSEFKFNLILYINFALSSSMLFIHELCLIEAPLMKRPIPLGKLHQETYSSW